MEGIRLSGKLGFRLLLSLGVRDFDLGTWCEYNERCILGLTSTSEDDLNPPGTPFYSGGVARDFSPRTAATAAADHIP